MKRGGGVRKGLVMLNGGHKSFAVVLCGSLKF